MPKTYLKYESVDVAGVITSPAANAVFSNTKSSRFVASPALDGVALWDMRSGESVSRSGANTNTQLAILRVPGSAAQVTQLASTIDGQTIAAGLVEACCVLTFHRYSDGSIRLWSPDTRTLRCTFNGHRQEISSLAFSKDGTQLASGSLDTDIVIWDVIEERGSYRLSGHIGRITSLVFVKNQLLSASVDTFVKVWDLQTQHCHQTVVGHRCEVWAMAVNDDETRLITGAADHLLRLWTLKDGEEFIGGLVGAIERKDRERCAGIGHCDGFVLVHSTGHNVELYRLRSASEIQKKIKRRLKRSKSDSVEVTVDDELMWLMLTKTGHRVRSIAVVRRKQELRVLMALTNNTLELHAMGTETSQKVYSLTLPGHRTGIRSLALGDTVLATCSKESVKVWDATHSLSSLRTIASGYGLSLVMVPGSKHVVVGTKSGQLELYDIASGSQLESIDAHDGPVWALKSLPDGRGLISGGGGDHSVKFWEYELILDPLFSSTTRRLSLTNTRVLVMEDAILALALSPDGRIIAVATLDSTVRLYYTDSFRFFVSLYGHKLPVLCIDISSDGQLLVSGSADKNVKIWGMGFGDCHKSLFAHDGSVTQVSFVPKTHHFFSTGKDGVLKYWDGDRFEELQRFAGNHGEIWGLSVSRGGGFAVTSGQDRSIRTYKRTDEQLFLEEERERRLDDMFESSLVDGKSHIVTAADSAGLTTLERGQASKRTLSTIKSGEDLVEALEMCESERVAKIEYAEAVAHIESQRALTAITPPMPERPQPNPLLLGMEPSDFLMARLARIKAPDLDEALLVLPFSLVPVLLTYVREWLDRGHTVELGCRTMLFLLRLHHGQIVSNQAMVELLDALTHIAELRLRERKDLHGFNLGGLKYIQSRMEEENQSFFEDARISKKSRKQ